MTTLKQEAESASPRRPAIELPRLHWTRILAISIFASPKGSLGFD